MIESISMCNFRRHRDLTLNFEPGMNVVRAANEMGKTTAVESLAYALFGTSALRTTFEESVTWGEDPKSLKVKATVQIGGDTLVFSRSKGGAEVTKNGTVFCTGQKEVSALSAQLLGADGNTAAKLMLAGQGSIRGALSEGPKALSVLIEELSDLSIFDRILNAAQEKLVLGNPALLEERLKGAESTLAAATETLPPAPDAEAHAAALAEIDAAMKANAEALPEFQAKVVTTAAAYDAAVKTYGEYLQLKRRAEDAQKRVVELKAQEEGLRAEANAVVDDQRDSLRAAIRDAEDNAARVVAYRFFNNLPVGRRFEGTSDVFQAALKGERELLDDCDKALKALEMREIQTKARRINHDTCDKCGQSVTHLEHVVKTNALVDAELGEIETLRVPHLSLKPGIVSLLTSLDDTDAFARKYEAALNKVMAYVTLDSTVYPPRATWNGTVPSESGVDIEGLRGQLKRNETALSNLTAAKARHGMSLQSRTTAEVEAAEAAEKLAKFVTPSADDVCRMEDAKTEAQSAEMAKRGDNILLQQARDAAVATFNNVDALWKMSKARIDDAEKTIASCKADLDSLEFNNALVKKLRALRPLVADQLWNTVLTSVSVMFSQMRGEASVVTKGKDGFRVNGQAVESLSGSTLDILGMALRCSLLKTFVPHCDLLILDEPAAAMDQDRTEAMMGFIKTAGFGQTILITHEDVSSVICDNILEI